MRSWGLGGREAAALVILSCLLVSVRGEEEEPSNLERDLIAESPSCRKDFEVVQSICKLTPESAKNNWAVLDCLQNPPEGRVNEKH
jgi:hypothetical protein